MESFETESIGFRHLKGNAKKAILDIVAPVIQDTVLPTVIPIIFPINAIYAVMDPNFNPNVAWAASGTKWERLPDNYVLWTSSNPTAGNVNANKIAAGLPNIKGEIGNALSDQAVGRASGAFTTWASAVGFQGSDKYKWTSFNFNANSGATTKNIYRDNVTTVQPPAIKTCMWRRVS